MQTFNIKTTYGDEQIVLTILEENNYYLVIYYGGIFGAVRQPKGNWEKVPDDDIVTGHLPQYEPGQPGERVEIEWNEELVQDIGSEIELWLENEA